MLTRLRRRQRGFTLIELLIVVAIIGIIAALLIPNFLESLQKAKQKRTMADMKSGGTAMMSWLTNEVGAAAAGFNVNLDSWNQGADNYAEVAELLTPTHVQTLPPKDGWKHPFAYTLNNENALADRVMGIFSGGRDSTVTAGGDWGTGATDPSTNGPYDPEDYDKDILWADGYFIIWPEKTTATGVAPAAPPATP